MPVVTADSPEGERPHLGTIPIRQLPGVHVATAASEDRIQRRIEGLAPGED